MSKNRKSKLKITIDCCSKLRQSDSTFTPWGSAKSDPYVVCQVRDRPYLCFKTPSRSGTLDPSWKSEVPGEIVVGQGDDLEFIVYDDKDKNTKEDPLGKVTLTYREYHIAEKKSGRGGSVFEVTKQLQGAGKNDGKSTISIKIEVIPMVSGNHDELNHCYVRILRATALRVPETATGGKADPYTLCRIHRKQLTAPTLATCRTKVAHKTFNPMWDEDDELFGYGAGEDILFTVFHYESSTGESERLGEASLSSDQFWPDGMDEVELPLLYGKNTQKGTVTVAIDVVVPEIAPTAPTDPSAGKVDEGCRWPIPFTLRSLDTGRVHQLVAYTRIGRSTRQLDPVVDLVLNGPGTEDISRLHADIKAWQDEDSDFWNIRVYATDRAGGRSGWGFGPGGGHSGGGTAVHGALPDPYMAQGPQLADDKVGTKVGPGSIIRFGTNELWVLDRCCLFQRSQLASVAAGSSKATGQTEDPSDVRHLRVPTQACYHALQGCRCWFDLVSVVLEWLGEPDEPPCVESIAVMDECGGPVSKHHALTLEQQEIYDVKKILPDVRIGTTLRLKLCSDPSLLAPVLAYLDDSRKKQDKIHQGRDQIPD